jgi:hypothetical protein
VGYQESFVKFENNDKAIEEIKKYVNRDTENYTTTLYNVVRVSDDIPMFSKGELVMIVGGERYDQRSPARLREGVEVQGAIDVIYIDDYLDDRRRGKAYLDKYFKNVHPNELGIELEEKD